MLIAGIAQAQAQPYGPSGPPVARYGASPDDGYPPPPPPPQDGYGPQQSYGAGAGGYGARPPSPAEMAQQFRTRLSLRPDQDEALNAFLKAVAPPPGMERRMREDEAAARAMTTPQRLDMVISEMDQMRQVMVARAQATKAFYSQLNPDQQRAFDAMGGQSGPEAVGQGGYGARPEPPGGPNAAFGTGSGGPH